eukprot:GHVH01000286.1.p1 GENE.GHVH01000286.1~~GHVH01000286.1.p1  ORF type:complete len:1037 (+),score=136.53 GHVH01000286.1:89-3199(+)
MCLSLIADELLSANDDRYCPGMNTVTQLPNGGPVVYFRSRNGVLSLVAMHAPHRVQILGYLPHPQFDRMSSVAIVPIDKESFVVVASLVGRKPVLSKPAAFKWPRKSLIPSRSSFPLSRPSTTSSSSSSSAGDEEGGEEPPKHKAVKFTTPPSDQPMDESPIVRTEFLRVDSLRVTTRQVHSDPKQDSAPWILTEVMDTSSIVGAECMPYDVQRKGRMCLNLHDWASTETWDSLEEIVNPMVLSFNASYVAMDPTQRCRYLICAPTLTWTAARDFEYSSFSVEDSHEHQLDRIDDDGQYIAQQCHGFFSEEKTDGSEDVSLRRLNNNTEALLRDSNDSQSSTAPVRGCPMVWIWAISASGAGEKRILDIKEYFGYIPTTIHMSPIELINADKTIEGLLLIYDCQRNIVVLCNWISSEYLGCWDLRSICSSWIDHASIDSHRCGCEDVEASCRSKAQRVKQGFGVGGDGRVFLTLGNSFILALRLSVTGEDRYEMEIVNSTLLEGFTRIGLSIHDPTTLLVMPDDSPAYMLDPDDLSFQCDSTAFIRSSSSLPPWLSSMNDSDYSIMQLILNRTCGCVCLNGRNTGSSLVIPFVGPLHLVNACPTNDKQEDKQEDIGCTTSGGVSKEAVDDSSYHSDAPPGMEGFTPHKNSDLRLSAELICEEDFESLVDLQSDVLAATSDGRFIAIMVESSTASKTVTIFDTLKISCYCSVQVSSVDAVAFWTGSDGLSTEIVLFSGCTSVSYIVIDAVGGLVNDPMHRELASSETLFLPDLADGVPSPSLKFLMPFYYKGAEYLCGVTLRRSIIFVWSPMDRRNPHRYSPPGAKITAWGCCTLPCGERICTIDDQGNLLVYNWVEESSKSFDLSPLLRKKMGINTQRFNWLQNLVPVGDGEVILWGWKYYRPREINSIAKIETGDSVSLLSLFPRCWAPQRISSNHIILQRSNDVDVGSPQINQMMDETDDVVIYEWPGTHKWHHALMEKQSSNCLVESSIPLALWHDRNCAYCLGARGVVTGDGTDASLIRLKRRCEMPLEPRP